MLGFATWDIVTPFLIILASSGAGLVWYRLYAHPLSVFPGPFLAAITDYYAAYYDLWMQGGQVKHLEMLHRRYGPVVRIRPNQLHFNDPQAFNDIYGSGTKLTKFAPFYDCFNEFESSFGYIDPTLARKRREILHPLFSRRAILKLEDVIQHSVDRLITSLLAYAGPGGRPANLHLGLRSMTMEVITSYCHANPFKSLDAPDFRHPALVALESTGGAFFLMQHFPFTRHLVFGLPEFLKSQEMIATEEIFKRIERQIDGLLADPSSLEQVEHETVYHQLLSAENTPSKRSLVDEAAALVGAGSDTVANTCVIGIFHVLSNPEIHKRLVKEIREVWPDKEVQVRLQTLEKLPYLSAVIKESLRLSHGVVSPLPRLAHEDTLIAGYSIPGGSVVAIGSTFVHLNPDIFPDPRTFNPDRWMGNQSKELENYLVAFSKGPRICLGINLAWAELYLLFGSLFRKFNMKVYQTTIQDLDFMAYLTPKYDKHFHALVEDTQD